MTQEYAALSKPSSLMRGRSLQNLGQKLIDWGIFQTLWSGTLESRLTEFANFYSFQVGVGLEFDKNAM